MLGEKQRGATLEQCICKLKLSQFMHTFRTEDKENLSLQSLNYQRQKIQLIGMSATISSISELLHMFGKDAELFSTEFRPVKLIQRVKIGDTVYRIETKEGEGSKSCCEFVHERELKNVCANSNNSTFYEFSLGTVNIILYLHRHWENVILTDLCFY